MNSDDYNGWQNQQFDEQLDQKHKWLLLGAEEKSKSVIQLTKGLNIGELLEIGSGTGALLETLDRLGFADSYYAIEPSEQMHLYMINRHAISRLVASEPVILEQCSLTDKRYDLAILSHVIEHVENAADLLNGTMQIADFVILEVPIEGNWMGNLRAAVRTCFTGLPRINNYSGHIHFFSIGDIRKLVHWCGGEIARSRLYVPHKQMQMARISGSLPRRTYAKLVWRLNRICGDWFWARCYYGHYAVLVRKRSSVADKNITLWPSMHYHNEI